MRLHPVPPRLLVACALAVVLGAAACGDDADDASTPPPTQEVRAAPLTGLPVGDDAVLERAVLIVKTDNISIAARPDQAGVDVADVVYEQPVEGTTRLAALYHSSAPDRVGPVRSTRLVDPAIVWPLGDAPYVYSGGTAEKVAAIEEAPVQTFDESDLAAFDAAIRDPAFDAPHDLFTVPTLVWDAAESHRPPEPLFSYLDDGGTFGGEPVEVVEIPNQADVRYTWDAAPGTWRREQLRDGAVSPHLAASGEQVAPENVIVQRIPGLERDSLVGEGDAWVLADGRLVEATWRRPALEDRTVYVDEAGAEIRLVPGRTWITLLLEGEPTFTRPADAGTSEE